MLPLLRHAFGRCFDLAVIGTFVGDVIVSDCMTQYSC